MNKIINIGNKPSVDTTIVNRDNEIMIMIENTKASNIRSKLDILINLIFQYD